MPPEERGDPMAQTATTLVGRFGDPRSRSRETGVTVELSDARDRDLVRRIGRRDGEAFRGLFGRYAPSALAVARRIVRQPYLAEEIVQEAFLAVWKNPGGYDDRRGSVRAWLMGMVHHRAVDAVRREESQRRRAEEAQTNEPVAAPDPAEQVVEEVGLPEERKAVRAALDVLPDEQRRVIELMYYDGLSQSTISERLGLPLGTVKSRTLLGMRRLRAQMAGLER
jgi:RNA polymerase sigma factor (sigma-70 family)